MGGRKRYAGWAPLGLADARGGGSILLDSSLLPAPPHHHGEGVRASPASAWCGMKDQLLLSLAASTH